MKLVTLDPDVALVFEWLGCDREDFPGARHLFVVVGPPEILLGAPRPESAARGGPGAPGPPQAATS